MRTIALILLIASLATGISIAYAEPRPAKQSWSERRRVELRIERDALRQRVWNLHRALRRQFRIPGSHALESALLCIHRYEGKWNDPAGPYYGGLQMDLIFQRTYGREFLRFFGTADKWPVSVQMAVAIRAYVSGRGFYPWPNTARYCGLIG